jgi:hypothetical protein
LSESKFHSTEVITRCPGQTPSSWPSKPLTARGRLEVAFLAIDLLNFAQPFICTFTALGCLSGRQIGETANKEVRGRNIRVTGMQFILRG